MTTLKLGRRPRKFHVNTLSLHDYLRDDVLPDPGPQDWTPAVTAAVGTDWGMDGNDMVGDCAAAMWSHAQMLFTANDGQIVIPTTADTLALYSAVTGYDPAQTQPDGSNPTDNGTCMTDLLAYLQKTGAILAWAEFDPAQIIRYRQAVAIWGASLNGVQVRQSDEDAFTAGTIWTPQADAVQGGHAILSPKADANGLTYVTWGAEQPASAAWTLENTQEAYIVATKEWVKQATQLTPAGLDMSKLLADIAAVKYQPA